MTQELPSSAPGSRRVGRYEVLRTLGQGGMGAVYLARQVDLARHVVIKVISGATSKEAIDRFRREALAIARVESDHVVKVYEFSFHAETPFIVMEYVDGPSLDKLLLQRGALPFEEAVRLAAETAYGLEAAHAAGVLHRDVKPANVLVTREGSAKVTDFGLAKVATAAELTSIGTMVGTPQYMSPEQAEGLEVLDARADVYALGVTLYELLSGTLPFQGRSVVETLSAKFEGRFVPLRQLVPSVPPAVEAACSRLMARSKANRPGSMGEAAALLERSIGRTSRVRTATHLAADLAAGIGIRDASTELETFEPTPEGLATFDHRPSPGAAVTLDAPPEVGDAPTLGVDPAARGGGPGQARAALAVPGPFGRFALERILGEGGMGTVYAAREVGLDRACVVKVIKPELARDPHVVERLRREANAAAKLSSDFVVRVYDFGVESGIPFISMEDVTGSSVDAILRRAGRLPALDATRIVLAAAKGLLAAHEQGIFHRDVKPANLLVARSGQVKVADFGLAKDVAEGPLTSKGAVIGTPAYMSPEQIEAETLDGRSDVYSLGATYYELLTGRRAFEGKTVVAVLTSRGQPLARPSEIDAGIPAAAERACLALMEPVREKRPAMAVAVEKLESVLAGLEGRAAPVVASGGRGGRAILVTLVVLVVLACVAAGAYLVLGRS